MTGSPAAMARLPACSSQTNTLSSSAEWPTCALELLDQEVSSAIILARLPNLEMPQLGSRLSNATD